MMGTSHLVCGITTGMVAATATGASPATTLAAGVVVGAWATVPDIDTEQALICRTVPPLRLLTPAVRALSRRMGGPSHRGITHQPAVQALVAAVSSFACLAPVVPWWFPVAAMLGMVCHTLCDLPTVSGVALLGPWSWREFHIHPRQLRFHVGSPVERLLIFPILVAAMITATPGVIPAGEAAVNGSHHIVNSLHQTR